MGQSMRAGKCLPADAALARATRRSTHEVCALISWLLHLAEVRCMVPLGVGKGMRVRYRGIGLHIALDCPGRCQNAVPCALIVHAVDYWCLPLLQF